MFLKLGSDDKTHSFHEKVHFGWLNRIRDNWDTVPDFKREHYVMYDLRECFDCRQLYKDCHGYHGRGVYPGDFATRVKEINSQSDLIWMLNFAGPS